MTKRNLNPETGIKTKMRTIHTKRDNLYTECGLFYPCGTLKVSESDNVNCKTCLKKQPNI